MANAEKIIPLSYSPPFDVTRVLSLAIEQSGSAIVITDPLGFIRYVNRRFSELTGYSESEVLGQNPRLLQSGLTPRSTYEAMWNALGSNRPWHGEVRNKRKDGSLYWSSLIVSPVTDGHNGVTHYIAVEDDISERKALEHELRMSMTLLENANAQLDSFTAMVAHDLRGPLGSIMNSIDMALDPHFDIRSPQTSALLGIARRSAHRAVELVNDLLALTRVERQAPEFRDVNLQEVLSNVREILLPKITAMKAVIDVGELPVVRGDETLLFQLFQNLFSNALKYSDGPPRISVRAERDGSRWRISVRDNGIGMAATEHEKIFRPFYRIASSSDHQGTGIGLATCQRVVHRHGGEIWVDSQPGAGSTFCFTLPATLTTA